MRIKYLLFSIGKFFGSIDIFHPLRSVMLYLKSGFYFRRANCKSPPFVVGKPRLLGSSYLEIGKSFSSLEGLRIEIFNEGTNNKKIHPKVKIGDSVNFNRNIHIGAINKITIGNNVLIGSNVLITDHNHSLNNSNIYSTGELITKGEVEIQDNVWIGDNVCILSGVTIGENSIIGCNTVVTKSIPKNTRVVGMGNRVL